MKASQVLVLSAACAALFIGCTQENASNKAPAVNQKAQTDGKGKNAADTVKQSGNPVKGPTNHTGAAP